VPDVTRLARVWSLVIEGARSLRWLQFRTAVLCGLAMTFVQAVIFIASIGMFAQRVPIERLLAMSLVTDQIRVLAVLVAVAAADRAVDSGARRRTAYVFAALGGCIAGVILSEPFSWAWRQYVIPGFAPPQRQWLHGTPALFYHPIFNLTYWLVVGGAGVFLYADRRAARKTAAMLHAAELDRIRRSKRALESRLQAMQARVEPQFLFNTLAQVERLYEIDAPLAGRTLDDLIAYLRAAMPRMRDTSSTIGQEIELVRSYLAIVRVRLADQLEFSIDVPAELADLTVPPMMLLPLVDHAVVHGLGRGREGGTLRIVVTVAAGRLRLSIADSGGGFVHGADGTGIASIRERLQALYGEDGRLELARRDDGGTEARLELPCEARVEERQDV
jgi:hypothetical protein